METSFRNRKHIYLLFLDCEKSILPHIVSVRLIMDLLYLHKETILELIAEKIREN